MVENLKKYVRIYATYKDLFGKKYDKNKLIKFIQGLPLDGIFDILSQIAFHTLNDEKINEVIAKNYIKFIDSVHKGNNSSAKKHMEDASQKEVLYSPQGLLAVWKWLLAYGNKENLTKSITPDIGIFLAIYLCQIVSDYLYDENTTIPVEYEMFRNAAFNSGMDLRSAIARTSSIYFDLAQNKTLFNEKEYIDFNKDFNSHYGYTLKEYLAIILGVSSLYISETKEIHSGWRRDLKETFSKSALAKKVEDIIKSISTDFNESSKWAKETLEEPWNFTLFQERPLFLLPDRTSFPIVPKLLYEQFFNSLFYKIRKIYPNADTKFINFFGRPFEAYVTMRMKEAISTSNIKYEFIPEFTFSKDDGKKSPDVMLKIGNKLLAIEAKSRRMKIDSLIGNDCKSIDEDLDRMVIDPIKQSDNCLSELLLKNNKVDLSGITEIYLMAVTMGEFPTLPPFEDKVKNALEKNLKTPVKSIFHLDIEEYENFCYLISRKNGKSIFRILDNKSTIGSQLPFKNFLISSRLPVRRLKVIEDKSAKFSKEILRMLFPDGK
jgi:hypothetical protein